MASTSGKMVGGLPVLEDRFLLDETYRMFISFERRLWEDPLLIGVGLVLFLALGVLPLRKKIKARGWTEKGAVHGYNQVGRRGWVEYCYAAVLVLCLGTQVIYKYLRGVFPFFVYPCHVITALCLYCSLSTSRTASYVAYAIPGALTGPILALLWPDTEPWYYFMEWELFLVQHYAVVLFPFIDGLRRPENRRFPLHKGDAIHFTVIGTFLLFLWILTACTLSALYTSANVMYTLYPPAFDFVDAFGLDYRQYMLPPLVASFPFLGLGYIAAGTVWRSMHTPLPDGVKDLSGKKKKQE